jgi:hypothetical protein
VSVDLKRFGELRGASSRAGFVSHLTEQLFMRWTQTFIPTLKETPGGRGNRFHKLLLRAGLVRN